MTVIMRPFGGDNFENSSSPCAEQLVIRPGIAKDMDGCPIWSKSKAFFVQQGLSPMLEWQMRDREGVPMDLTNCLTSDSGNPDATITGSATVLLRELMTTRDSPCNWDRLFSFAGTPEELQDGVLRFTIPTTDIPAAGIYQLGIGIRNPANVVIIANTALLSVERSLFGDPDLSLVGPFTLEELRWSIRDNVPENLWVGDVEFGDTEIISSICRPIRYWNELPPSIVMFNTLTFPYRENWMRATYGYLLETAAANFRRTRLPYSAGGVTVDDRNRFREYDEIAREIRAEYKEFVAIKKAQINANGGFLIVT